MLKTIFRVYLLTTVFYIHSSQSAKEESPESLDYEDYDERVSSTTYLPRTTSNVVSRRKVTTTSVPTTSRTTTAAATTWGRKKLSRHSTTQKRQSEQILATWRPPKRTTTPMIGEEKVTHKHSTTKTPKSTTTRQQSLTTSTPSSPRRRSHQKQKTTTKTTTTIPTTQQIESIATTPNKNSYGSYQFHSFSGPYEVLKRTGNKRVTDIPSETSRVTIAASVPKTARRRVQEVSTTHISTSPIPFVFPTIPVTTSAYSNPFPRRLRLAHRNSPAIRRRTPKLKTTAAKEEISTTEIWNSASGETSTPSLIFATASPATVAVSYRPTTATTTTSQIPSIDEETKQLRGEVVEIQQLEDY